MNESNELNQIITNLLQCIAAEEVEEVHGPKERYRAGAAKAAKAWSGSWIGYHARVYFEGMRIPPPGMHFDSDWGFHHVGRTSPGWMEHSEDAVERWLRQQARLASLSKARKASHDAEAIFDLAKNEALSILRAYLADNQNDFVASTVKTIEQIHILTASDYISGIRPRSIRSADSLAISQGLQIPPHIKKEAEIFELDAPFVACQTLVRELRPVALFFARITKKGLPDMTIKPLAKGQKIFIGHGRSPLWRELKDFISERLHLPWEEFNREPTAGKSTKERLSEMLDSAAMAFLVMTAEDAQPDKTFNARLNVVHELGLFQGRLGFTRAIILLEENCEEFSNIHGLVQIRFATGDISSKFEEIRRVLEREGLLGKISTPAPAKTKKRVRAL